MPKGVLILPSYYEAIKSKKDRDRLALYDAIFAYGFNGLEPTLTGDNASIFALIRPSMDKSARRYEAAQANGAKGGRPKNQKKNQSKKQTESKPDNQKQNQDYDLDLDSDYDSDLDSDSPGFRAGAPKQEEVREYAKEISASPVDADAFWYHYQATNWMIRGEQVTDWRSLFRSWLIKGQRFASSGNQPQTPTAGQRPNTARENAAWLRDFLANDDESDDQDGSL